MSGVYLDHCATTPMDPSVVESMEDVRDRLTGNPSSVHTFGRRARGIMNEARARIAQTLEVSPSEILFTASGSEANNLVLKGTALRCYPNPLHLIMASIEHDSVRHTARYLASRFEHVYLTEIAPGIDGRVDPERFAAACDTDGETIIASMAVNNETGVIQPIEELASVARDRSARFLCDGVQALGRLPLSGKLANLDFLSASSHKIYGPRGIGLLYLRRGNVLDPLIHGGHQEAGFRAGTEDVESMVGFAKALEVVSDRMAENGRQLQSLETRFLESLRSQDPSFVLNGESPRVPGVLNLAFPGISGHDLVVGMDLAGFAISAGSACSSGVIESSHVLTSMNLDPWRIEGGIRISFGMGNTEDEADRAGKTLASLAGRLRNEAEAVSSR